MPGNPRRTHCKRGHPLHPNNVYVRPDNGHRNCRRCHNERARLYARRKACPLCKQLSEGRFCFLHNGSEFTYV